MENGIVLTQCAMCGKFFEAKRKDALFCSANCRQKAARGKEPEFGADRPQSPAAIEKKPEPAVVPSKAHTTIQDLIDTAKTAPKPAEGIVNPSAPKNRQMVEPKPGTNAYYLKYGRFDAD